MAQEHGSFTVTLEQVSGFEFKVRFDGLAVPDLLLDEPEPLGHGVGPNAGRVLAAAVANCLSASLLFCLSKSRVQADGVKTTVTARSGRNAEGRLRIIGVDVQIALGTVDGNATRLGRCLDLFQDYCMVTESVRQGIPVGVRVVDARGAMLLDRPA